MGFRRNMAKLNPPRKVRGGLSCPVGRSSCRRRALGGKHTRSALAACPVDPGSGRSDAVRCLVVVPVFAEPGAAPGHPGFSVLYGQNDRLDKAFLDFHLRTFCFYPGRPAHCFCLGSNVAEQWGTVLALRKKCDGFVKFFDRTGKVRRNMP